MMSNDLSRRDFLRLSSGTLALGVLPQLNLTQPPGVALIGAGQQGLRLLHGLWSLSTGARVIGVYDVWEPALENAAQLARTAGRPLRVTYDEAEFWSWADVQAVLIVTPDFSHAPLALAALNAGKSVYLETPLTRAASDMHRLKEFAEVRHLSLFSGDFHLRHPRYQLAAGIIKSGLLGKIHRIHVNVHRTHQTTHSDQVNSGVIQWQKHSETSYGAALSQFAEKMAVVHQVMGVSQPTHLKAHGGVYVASNQQQTTPDTFYALLDYANGFVVSFSALTGDALHDSFTLHGTHGTLDLQHHTLTADHAVTNPIPVWLARKVTQQLQQSNVTDTDLLTTHLTDWLSKLHHQQAWLSSWEQASHLVALTEQAAAQHFGEY